MARPSHRELLLIAGSRLIHEKGYGGTSVRDIASAADVPLGSFTNHFRTKEEFGLEVLERYYAFIRDLMDKTLLNQKRRPLERIRRYVDGLITVLNDGWVRKGCVLGNFSAELTDENEAIRRRVADIFLEQQDAVKACLDEALLVGELPAKSNTADLAAFFVSSQQGATLLCRAQRSVEPMRRFKRVIFSAMFVEKAGGKR